VSRLEDAAIRHEWAVKELLLAWADLIAESMKAKEEGMSITRIAEISGISRMTLHKYASAAISANLSDPEND
jgi:response regulator of citrate/malate metabolism